MPVGQPVTPIMKPLSKATLSVISFFSNNKASACLVDVALCIASINPSSINLEESSAKTSM